MMKSIKNTWNVIITVLTVLSLGVGVTTMIARACGINLYTVLSGSMEPLYPTGSLLYVKEVNGETLEEGRVVTFYLSEDMVVTHRILSRVEDDAGNLKGYETKGDANNTKDGGLADPSSIIGIPVFMVPKAGYALMFMQTYAGRMTMIIAVAVLLAVTALIDFLSHITQGKCLMAPK